MTGEWTPLAVDFFADPTIRKVGRDAALLYVAGLCYCQEHLTDGVIPDGSVDLLAVASWSKPAAARTLASAGLWEAVDGGYRVARWSEWNKPASVVLAAREARQGGGAFGNHRRWHEARGVTEPGCRWCDRSTDRSTDRLTDRSPDRSTRRSTIAQASPPDTEHSPTTSLPTNAGRSDEGGEVVEAALARWIESRYRNVETTNGVKNPTALRKRLAVEAEDQRPRAVELHAKHPTMRASEIAGVLLGNVSILASYRPGEAS